MTDNNHDAYLGRLDKKLAQMRAKQGLPPKEEDTFNVSPIREAFTSDVEAIAEAQKYFEEQEMPFYQKVESASVSDVDHIAKGIDFVSIYQAVIDKPIGDLKQVGEEYYISCPFRYHTDENPSATYDPARNVWHCQGGGNQYHKGGSGAIDAVGAWLGYATPEERRDHYHHILCEIVKRMPGNFPGINIVPDQSAPSGERIISTVRQEEIAKELESQQPQEPQEPQELQQPQEPQEPHRNTQDEGASEHRRIKYIGVPPPEDEEELQRIENIKKEILKAFPESERFRIKSELNKEIPTRSIRIAPEHGDNQHTLDIDWQRLLGKCHFGKTYMEEACKDDCPEMYHFWRMMQCAAFALGKEICIPDSTPVFANLFVVLVGGTGIGKSKSEHLQREVISRVLPYDPNADNTNGGVHFPKGPRSGPSLVKEISHELRINGKETGDWAENKRTLLEYNELSDLMTPAEWRGSELGGKIIQSFDGRGEIRGNSQTAKDVAIDPFVQLITTVQAARLDALLSQGGIDSGLVNRHLFVGGVGKKRESSSWFSGGTPDAQRIRDAYQELNEFCDSLIRKGHNTINWTDEGAAVWELWFRTVIDPMYDFSDPLNPDKDTNPLTVRSDLYLKKIQIILAAMKHESSITADTVRDVIGLWPYIKNMHTSIEDSIGKDIFNETDKKITTVIDNHWQKYSQGISIAKIKHNTKIGKDKLNTKQVTESIDRLVREELISSYETTPRRGRPGVRWIPWGEVPPPMQTPKKASGQNVKKKTKNNNKKDTNEGTNQES